MTTLLAIGGWVAAAVLVGLAVYGGLCVLMRLDDRLRPVEPRDDMLGDFPNVPKVVCHSGTYTETEA